MSNRFTSWLVAALLLALGPVGAASAQVSVTAADPSSALQGTVSLDVTITGDGFDKSAAVRFLVTGTEGTGGITVKKVSVKNARRLVATIDVADTASVTGFDVEVTLSSGRKGKGTTLFSVQSKVANTDPCIAGSSNWLGFPAFAYFTNIPGGGSQDPYELRVASANGLCSLRVMTLPENALTISFAESSATPGLYRLIVGKYLFLHLAEFRVGTDPSTGRPTLDDLNVVPNFRPTGDGLGFSGADISPDGERVALIRNFGWDRLVTIAAFDDATPDIDVCGLTGAVEPPGDWADLAWAPSGRIAFMQHTYEWKRLVGVDGNNPEPSPTQCDPELILSFREGPIGPAPPLGEPSQAHRQTTARLLGVEYTALKVSFSQNGGRKGTQLVCEIWVWNTSAQPAIRVLDRTNGAPRGGFPSFSSNGSLFYQPEPGTGCNPPYEVGEFGFLGVPTSIQGTPSGQQPTGLKRRPPN
jgi:hypothetical protein